jgi:short-subunit dehydrogenase
MESVAGKKVLITGAAMGMGRLYAELAVKEGAADLVLWDIDKHSLDATAAELGALGGTVHAQVVNVAEPQAIQQAAKRVEQEVGDINILFNNAGIVVHADFWDHTWLQVEKTMAINALAPQHIAHRFLPGMIRSAGPCHIVNIASAAGFLPVPGMSVYCSSKWAVVGWSDTLRLELVKAGHRHVKVTTVCPSYISTGMFQGAKPASFTPLLTPEYVVHKVWKKMKVGAPFVTMPWTVHCSLALKELLPAAWFDFLVGRLCGVYKSMDEFTGRDKQKPGKKAA